MGANFITGTGTDIGKTWLCCALLRHWRAAGLRPAALKPVLSGFDPDAPQASDAGQLLAALEQPLDERTLEAIAPWRYAAALSPDMAAAQERRQVPFDALVAFTRRAALAERGPLLVEGVGGVMVPLDQTHTVRDWVAASSLPAVLVAGSYLGSMSHTLTALESLVRADAPVAAIVVNESEGSSVPIELTLDSLLRHVAGIPLVGIRRADPAPGIARLAALLGA
jgi:dethiobiotin synthetase